MMRSDVSAAANCARCKKAWRTCSGAIAHAHSGRRDRSDLAAMCVKPALQVIAMHRMNTIQWVQSMACTSVRRHSTTSLAIGGGPLSAYSCVRNRCLGVGGVGDTTATTATVALAGHPSSACSLPSNVQMLRGLCRKSCFLHPCHSAHTTDLTLGVALCTCSE